MQSTGHKHHRNLWWPFSGGSTNTACKASTRLGCIVVVVAIGRTVSYRSGGPCLRWKVGLLMRE